MGGTIWSFFMPELSPFRKASAFRSCRRRFGVLRGVTPSEGAACVRIGWNSADERRRDRTESPRDVRTPMHHVPFIVVALFALGQGITAAAETTGPAGDPLHSAKCRSALQALQAAESALAPATSAA